MPKVTTLRRLAFAFFLFSTLCVLSPGMANAQESLPWAEEQVQFSEEAYQQARFRSAMGIALQLRSQTTLNDAQRVRLEVVIASSALALGLQSASEEAFARLLQLAPDFRFGPETAPKLHRSLETARQKRGEA